MTSKRRDPAESGCLVQRHRGRLTVTGLEADELETEPASGGFELAKHVASNSTPSHVFQHEHAPHFDDRVIQRPKSAAGDWRVIEVCNQVDASVWRWTVGGPSIRIQLGIELMCLDRGFPQQAERVFTLGVHFLGYHPGRDTMQVIPAGANLLALLESDHAVVCLGGPFL